MMMRAKHIHNIPCICILVLALISSYHATAESVVTYNIMAYGATPKADIDEALLNAWKAAMRSTSSSKIVIPVGAWKLSQVMLEGPNLSPIEIENQGTIQANPDLQTMAHKLAPWITINNVNFLTLSGGIYDGQGQQSWALNDCHTNKQCNELPINLRLSRINNSIIKDVTSRDSKFFHIKCLNSRNVSFTRVTVSAPGDSPNTDGINVARSTMVNITDSIIGTGDDCISMGEYLSQVHIRNVTCGPGHGISIGSLGHHVGERDVTGIYVTNCSFIGTTNGVRIKTWPSGPASLLVSDVHYEDLIMYNASNPINIDQNYCPSHQCDLNGPSLVQINNVEINHVRGSTSSKDAVYIFCSKAKPCKNVRIGDVDLSYTGTRQGEFGTTCVHNISPIFYGHQNPPICVV